MLLPKLVTKKKKPSIKSSIGIYRTLGAFYFEIAHKYKLKQSKNGRVANQIDFETQISHRL